MAGWNSPALNNKQGFERSSSFTKEEIEEFWNKHKLAQQEHLQAAASVANELKLAHQDNTSKEDGSSNEEVDGEEAPSVEEELEKQNSFKDWWTKSSWAFLNEPAMKRMEAANYKYLAQFHVVDPIEKASSAPSSPHSL